MVFVYMRNCENIFIFLFYIFECDENVIIIESKIIFKKLFQKNFCLFKYKIPNKIIKSFN